MRISTDFNPSQKEISFLYNKLFEYNCREVENYSYQDFVLKCTDESDLIIGGLHGQIGGDWLYIASLWVDESYRQKGLGKDLLSKAESIAVKNKCFGVYLYTYSFQSPGFYEKFGYQAFGTLENFTKGNSKIYMKKILSI